ncbi:Phosphatase 2C family protein [Theobroma cacao]|uniref:Protein phosphatase n=1 Tax=Theobroma cacao TaxID=3641 RepID=A0A061DMK0_THECC|nr:Phosphatase 2C family protein [Theobroma cacao]
MPPVVLSKLNPAIYTGFRRAISGRRVRLCNPTSSLLRQRKLLSANSGLTQFLPYSINLISDNRFVLNQLCTSAKTMAVSGSKAVFGDVYVDELVASCGNGLDFLKPTGVYFPDGSRTSCQKVSMTLRKREQTNNRFVYGYYVCDAMQRNTKYNPPFGPKIKSIHTSSLLCSCAGAAHDVSFDGGSKDEQIASLPEQAIPGEKTLTLVSGSCYLPHPAKEETGGEDAHFICANEQAIGVADGVGGWAEVGIDAGEFARELMSNSVTVIQDEPKGSIDPARVLERAHSSTKSQGSSTACIIALTKEGIHAINLGDSGFIVVRDGCTVFHSPVQQHGFNFTYQLESGNDGDLPSSGQVFRIPVLPGDVIVAGTDGLFDNLYNNEVTAAVVHALRSGFSPEVTAKQIAALARERAVDKHQQTPFAKAALDAGFRYYGGKLDDITVVVSYVTSSTHV